jgi:hypothetical protein
MYLHSGGYNSESIYNPYTKGLERAKFRKAAARPDRIHYKKTRVSRRSLMAGEGFGVPPVWRCRGASDTRYLGVIAVWVGVGKGR